MQMSSFRDMKNKNWTTGKKEDDAMSVDAALLASE